MKKTIKYIAAAFAVLILCFAFSGCSDNRKNSIYISEVMSSNTSVLADEKGEFCDWIELHNPTDKDIDLSDWSLTDDGTNARKFVFPSMTIKSGEYLVLFADGNEKTDIENGAVHLPFSISSQKGESIRLYDSRTNLVCQLSVPILEDNISYGVDENGNETILEAATPGAPNGSKQEAEEVFKEPKNYQVVINEYSTNETQTLLDDEGDFVSWVELYNKGSESVNLRSFSLTDDEADIQKWTFPDVTVEAGKYLVVYLSGNEREYNGTGQLHASFRLNGNENQLMLFDESGNEVDSCVVYKLFSNLSCGRKADDENTFAFFASATPGRKNANVSFSSVDSARLTGSKALAITEVAAVNTSVKSPNGTYSDYIELYNASDKKINLKNYKLSDSKKAESFLKLPDRILESGEYAVVYCTDEKNAGGITLDIGLNRYGETVYLADSNSVIVDSLTYGRLCPGYSCGRVPGKTGDTVYFDILTPGGKNKGRVLSKALANPAFSLDSSYVKKGTEVRIISDYDVFYTLDGSVPTESSKRYTEPIKIKKSQSVRARAFKEGCVPSDTVTATYLVEAKHDLPVVFLTADKADLFSRQRGIWADGPNISSEFPYLGANYWQDWERDVHFEFMEKDGEGGISFDAGIKVFGQFSRALPQKSVSINLRDKYGPTEVCYPFFEDNDVNVFSSLVLRNSGQDFNIAHIRDAYCAMIVKNSVDVDIMDYRPVAVYVNGSYYGIYDLREKIDEDYLANHRGVDKSKTDLIKGNNNVQLGSMDSYNKLLKYIRTHDVTDKKVYDYICSQIDIDELISYWMCESFFTNTDTGNIRFYRENTKGGKWRWVFFDSDWSLFPSTYKLNYIDNYLDPHGHGVSDAFDTTIMTRLIKNKSFRKRLLEIHSEHLKTTFETKRMLKIFDSMIDEIDSEMKRHTKRWDALSYASWQKNTATLRNIIKENRKLFIKKMKASFNMTKEEIELYIPKN